jgi:hypothetical protein
MTALLFKAKMRETIPKMELTQREDGRPIFFHDHHDFPEFVVEHDRRIMVNGELNNRHPSRMIGGI